MKRTFTNAKLILKDEIVERGFLTVEDGCIADFGQGGACGEDVGGAYISPGFIDIHVHGGGGADFRDADEQAFLTVLKTHARGGTTTIFPTLSSCSNETMRESIAVFERLRDRAEEYDIPNLGGMHLEGPYFAQSQRGAQDESLIRLPDPAEYLPLLDSTDVIARWSVACELPGALELGDELKRRGITVSVGHSDASAAQVAEAIKHGFSCVTHLYSSCSMVRRNGPFREAGVVEAGYLYDGLDVEMIGDGVHLPKELLQLIYKVKGADRIALVTDSIRPGGLELASGTVMYDDREGRREVIVESGVAIMPDRKAFAGSIATTARLVRTMLSVGVPMCDAVKMASATPARIMGIEDITGDIAKGKRADLLIFTGNVELKEVIVAGRSVQSA